MSALASAVDNKMEVQRDSFRRFNNDKYSFVASVVMAAKDEVQELPRVPQSFVAVAKNMYMNLEDQTMYDAEAIAGGKIVGLYNRHEDLEINVCKEKHLTNMRSKSSDGTVQLTPYTQLSLEQCIDFLQDDELLEVTPKNLRLRKRYLDANERKRAAK
jgi:hypothetical protein